MNTLAYAIALTATALLLGFASTATADPDSPTPESSGWACVIVHVNLLPPGVWIGPQCVHILG